MRGQHCLTTQLRRLARPTLERTSPREQAQRCAAIVRDSSRTFGRLLIAPWSRSHHSGGRTRRTTRLLVVIKDCVASFGRRGDLAARQGTVESLKRVGTSGEPLCQVYGAPWKSEARAPACRPRPTTPWTPAPVSASKGAAGVFEGWFSAASSARTPLRRTSSPACSAARSPAAPATRGQQSSKSQNLEAIVAADRGGRVAALSLGTPADGRRSRTATAAHAPPCRGRAPAQARGRPAA